MPTHAAGVKCRDVRCGRMAIWKWRKPKVESKYPTPLTMHQLWMVSLSAPVSRDKDASRTTLYPFTRVDDGKAEKWLADQWEITAPEQLLGRLSGLASTGYRAMARRRTRRRAAGLGHRAVRGHLPARLRLRDAERGRHLEPAQERRADGRGDVRLLAGVRRPLPPGQAGLAGEPPRHAGPGLPRAPGRLRRPPPGAPGPREPDAAPGTSPPGKRSATRTGPAPPARAWRDPPGPAKP